MHLPELNILKNFWKNYLNETSQDHVLRWDVVFFPALTLTGKDGSTADEDLISEGGDKVRIPPGGFSSLVLY